MEQARRTHRRPSSPLLVALIGSLAACTADHDDTSVVSRSEAFSSRIASVWAVNDGEKIKRTDIANPNKASNSVWNGHQVSIFAARNETVAFQLILQAGSTGASKVDVKLLQLVNGSTGHTLAWLPEGADPTNSVGRAIERFVQGYIDITSATPPGWFYDDPTARPANMTGSVPDALIPFNASAKMGGAPFDIPANQNQGVWFDVTVPATAAPGTYSGTITVTEDGVATQTMPVTLTVYDFVLPDINHFQVMIYFDEAQVARRFGSSDPELVARHHRMAHQHRVEFTKPYGPTVPQSDLDLISGAAFTPARGYGGPGQGVGYTIIPATMYRLPPPWDGTTAQNWGMADAFMNWLGGVKPWATTFLYLIDEPKPTMFPWIASKGSEYHNNPGPGRALPTLVTTWPDATLASAIDIWATPTNQYDPARAAVERAAGKRWWPYNGHRPASGTQIIDAPAVDCRVVMWAGWNYGVRLWFYWEANYWKLDPPAGDIDVFVDQGVYVGDGRLIYPGRDVVFPAHDAGIAGPISSIRLKNIRRGAQDYEYLWLADQKGLSTQASAVARTAVPVAFKDALGKAPSWSMSGSDWDAKRQQLAQLLSGSPPPSMPPQGQTATQLGIAVATASADDGNGNVGERAIDGSLGTRWSASGNGQWLRLDLGTNQRVSYAKVAPYNGANRIFTFDLQTSTDGTSWKTVGSGLKTALHNDRQTFDFSDVDPARYVRLVGHMNSASAWNSYTEVEVWGGPSASSGSGGTGGSSGSSTKIAVGPAAVTASSHDGNVPANTVDGHLATRWSASGDGQWIRFDLGVNRKVSHMKVAPYNGANRVMTFDLQSSIDGVTWRPLAIGLKTALSNSLQPFDFPDIDPARYVRLVGHMNSSNAWNSYTEIEIWGGPSGATAP